MVCAYTNNDINDENCYLLNLDGTVASKSLKYSYSPFMGIYIEKTGNFIPGERAINGGELNRINQIKDEVKKYNINVYGYVYKSEYDELLLSTGYNIKTLPKMYILHGVNSTDIYNSLGRALNDKVVKKLLFENLNLIDYIDLRFKDQIVYKKKLQDVAQNKDEQN